MPLTHWPTRIKIVVIIIVYYRYCTYNTGVRLGSRSSGCAGRLMSTEPNENRKKYGNTLGNVVYDYRITFIARIVSAIFLLFFISHY